MCVSSSSIFEKQVQLESTMTRRLWELLTFNERICPSCKSSWSPEVDNPVSCPRCKSYSLSKTRQSWPEGFVDVSFYWGDFEIRDRSWKEQQDTLDKERRSKKKAVFETTAKKWRDEYITRLWKETHQSKKIAIRTGYTQSEVEHILVEELKIAVWKKKPNQQ
jgi:DNA-directed RNA polymerase subunit RPC12/RpoP